MSVWILLANVTSLKALTRLAGPSSRMNPVLAIPDGQHDLAEVPSGFEAGVRGPNVVETVNAVYHRAYRTCGDPGQPARISARGDAALFLDRRRAQDRAAYLQSLQDDRIQVDFGQSPRKHSDEVEHALFRQQFHILPKRARPGHVDDEVEACLLAPIRCR